MEEAKKVEEAVDDIEFAVVLSKLKDGTVGLKEVEGQPGPKLLDDVYGAICIIKRNIEAQQTAAATHEVMMAAAQQMQQQMSGGQTAADGKLFIPDNKNIR